MMLLRNIFIVGAAKAGTTALYYLLNQHPEICFPVVKEPNFFSNLNGEQEVVKPGTGPGDSSTTWTDSLDAYHKLYRCSKDHHYRLDASVSYLYSTRAACHISRYSPGARIVIVLRNPVDRAWSHYKHLVRDGRESLSFEEALNREEERIKEGWEFSWHLKQMGLYSRQIQRYFDHFGRSQVRVFLFDDLKANIKDIIKITEEFLQLPEFSYNFQQNRHNISGVSRSKTLSGLVNRVVRYKSTINKVVPPMATHWLMQLFRSVNTKEAALTLREETRKELISFFKDDIKKTEQLINRDLSTWLS